MSHLDHLIARRNAVAAELASLTPARPGGGVNSIAGDVDHSKYKNDLYAELERLNALIDAAYAEAGVPCYSHSRGAAL